MNLKNIKITSSSLYWGLIITFAVLYMCVGFVSTLHSITFFQLANNMGLAILLGVTYEVGQASVLFSILMTKNKDKFLPWALMILLTALQVTANVYASFKFMSLSGSNDWMYWQKSILIGVQAANPETYQVIISWITGALLPIVALGMTALVSENLKMMAEEVDKEPTKEPDKEVPKYVYDGKLTASEPNYNSVTIDANNPSSVFQTFPKKTYVDVPDEYAKNVEQLIKDKFKQYNSLNIPADYPSSKIEHSTIQEPFVVDIPKPIAPINGMPATINDPDEEKRELDNALLVHNIKQEFAKGNAESIKLENHLNEIVPMTNVDFEKQNGLVYDDSWEKDEIPFELQQWVNEPKIESTPLETEVVHTDNIVNDIKQDQTPSVGLYKENKDGYWTVKTPINKVRGWHLKKEYVDDNGDVYTYGQYVPPTQIESSASKKA